MKDHTVTIGEAAARTGLTAKAIRLYERRGLLGAPERNHSGYRTYGANDLAVLSFIRQARNLGLRLDEIGLYAANAGWRLRILCVGRVVH